MPSVNHLPVEVLNHIFQDVAEINSFDDAERRSFPFNVASACTFWLQIAKSNRSLWRAISIDVADDPTPFLDIFNLFESRDDFALSINIFSSNRHKPMECAVGSDDWRARRDMENTRTRLLFEHLRPSLPRYAEIIFDLEFQSSLPSAADILVRDLPRLGGLILQCSVYDVDENDEIKVILPDVIFPLRYKCTFLKHLGITGHSFMELAQLGADWISEFHEHINYMTLHINRFTFHDDFSVENEDYSRSLRNFSRLISHTGTFNNIELSDFSLNYDPQLAEQTDAHEFTITTRRIVFKAASSDFIATFFPHTLLRGHKLEVVFDSCSLPAALGEDDVMLTRRLPSLTFHNIPCDTSLDDNNLFRMITALNPSKVSLINCAGVNDVFFSLLIGDGNYPPCQHMRSLHITVCLYFSVQALKAYVSARANAVSNPIPLALLGRVFPLQLVVVSRGPPISADDAAWFSDRNNVGVCVVRWNVGHNE